MVKRAKNLIWNSCLLLGLLSLFVMIGCAKPPTKEMADAEAALAAAKLAEADVYVPDEYKSAENELAKARVEIEKKEYDNARNAAIESKRLSDASVIHAGEAKARAKADAEQIIAQLKGALGEAKGAQAETYYQDEYNRLNGKLSELENDYNSGKYLDVINKGRDAVAQTNDLTNKSRIAAAEAVRKQAEDARRQQEAQEAARRAEAEEVARRAQAEVEAETRRIAEAKAAEEAARAAAEAQTHKVSKGESLWRIAKSDKIYSNPFEWPLLFEANRTQIKDPDLIFPKQELKIARNMADSEIEQAIHKAKTRGPWSLYDGK